MPWMYQQETINGLIPFGFSSYRLTQKKKQKLALPDKLWWRILELGVQSGGFTFKDLCCLSISSRHLHWLSFHDDLWSLLLSFDFAINRSSSSPLLSSKSLYKFFVFFNGSLERRIWLGLGLGIRKHNVVLVETRVHAMEMELKLFRVVGVGNLIYLFRVMGVGNFFSNLSFVLVFWVLHNPSEETLTSYEVVFSAFCVLYFF